MQNSRLILYTCWTSLLTNLAGEQRGLITKYANARTRDEIAEADRKLLETLMDQAKRKLKDAQPKELARHSAEDNGLLRLADWQLARTQDLHGLITSDTWLGQATAEAIAGVLKTAGQTVEVKRITDLRTDSLAGFRCAMSDLARLCAQEVRGLRDGGRRVVFNLTGGFKSVQGFMQALGMVYADESVYVFERTDQLLRLPRLPVTLDAGAILRRYERVFRRIAVGLPVSKVETDGVPESLLLEIDGQVSLDVWGDVVWAEAQAGLYRERLLEPISEKLRFSPHFVRSVNQICQNAERLCLINQRLDQLARHLEEPSFNPRSLDFKKLRIPRAQSTHECDAWSDQDAKRLFGHFDGNVFIVDDLDQGLH